MKNARPIILIGVLCLCILIQGRNIAFGQTLYLAVTDYSKTGCLSYPVSADSEFVIEYFHSYSRFPVREIYRVRPDRNIVLTKIVQKASQCSDIIYPNVRLRKDGWVEIYDINKIIPEVSFISGSPDLGNHKLEINGQVFRLSDRFEGGSEIFIRIENIDPCVMNGSN